MLAIEIGENPQPSSTHWMHLKYSCTKFNLWIFRADLRSKTLVMSQSIVGPAAIVHFAFIMQLAIANYTSYAEQGYTFIYLHVWCKFDVSRNPFDHIVC